MPDDLKDDLKNELSTVGEAIAQITAKITALCNQQRKPTPEELAELQKKLKQLSDYYDLLKAL